MIKAKHLEVEYEGIKSSVKGRYISSKCRNQELNELDKTIFSIKEVAKTYKKNTIYTVSFGKGRIKVLLYSQMHGNETTGTKALFDFYNYYKRNKGKLENIFTFVTIPILSPDSADDYIRRLASGVDPNRDARAKNTIEIKALYTVLESFKPDYTINLHDQRNIFGVGESTEPATLSFLAPSFDKQKTIDEDRKRVMAWINYVRQGLKPVLTDKIGRYTDEFYPTASGDNLQKQGFKNMLIEAGYFPNDPNREKTREYNFYAIVLAIDWLIDNFESTSGWEEYDTIPQNNTIFCDIIIRDTVIMDTLVDVGIMEVLSLKNNTLTNSYKCNMIGDLGDYVGHNEVSGKTVKWIENPSIMRPVSLIASDFKIEKGIKSIK